MTENPELTWQGIPSFQRLSSDHSGLLKTVSAVSMKNPDIWNFYSSPTMNNGKLIRYFRSHLYVIVSNMTHFLILFDIREKKWLSWNCVSAELMQNLDIWNFHSSMALNIMGIIIHQSMLYELLSNLIGSLLLYYDFILHWFTFYGAFKLLILHGFTFFGGFDWFVSSLWPNAVLQLDAAQLTLLAVCCIWWVQFEKFKQTVAETATTVLFELICLHLQA